MKQRNKLKPSEHIELGQLLKDAQRNLERAGMMCRPFGRLSQELFELSDRLRGSRSFLERCLIQQMGSESALMEGRSVRDVYFGLVTEEV